MILILGYALLLIVLLVVPALVGYVVGNGDEITAWITSATAFVTYLLVGKFTKDP